MLSQCPRSASCLRYLVYSASPPFFHHSFIDPRTETSESGCPSYLSNEVQRFARGFKRAMRRLRYGDVAEFRYRVCDELACWQSQFYRYSSGQKPLTPEQQARVRDVFHEFGVTDGELFDAYEEAYDLG